MLTQPNHNSRHSIDGRSDLHSNRTGGIKEDINGGTQRSASRGGHQPEIKVDPKLAKALSQINARTFQAFLSRRYANFDLAYLVTLVSALYEDSIPMNGSQNDLIYKTSWDDISKQLFNAARIIRSLTKLKYSASSDPNSDFIKKLTRI